MPECANCFKSPCVCPKGHGKSQPWQPPYVDPATIPDDNWFVRRALRRWAAERSDTGSTHRGKSIRDFILEEFVADGGTPDHPDYLRLEEFLQRSPRPEG